MASGICSEKELMEAVRALPKEVRQYLGHELRNRLTHIMAHAEGCDFLPLPEPVKEGLHKVRDEVMDLSNVLTQFHL